MTFDSIISVLDLRASRTRDDCMYIFFFFNAILHVSRVSKDMGLETGY